MNGKQLAVLLAIIGAATVLLNFETTSKVSEFEAWKATHSIKYASEFENAYRERIFLENLAKVNAHNANEKKTYEQGLNQFSALTTEEFAQQYLGTIVPTSTIESNEEMTVTIGDVDWTTSPGVVQAVKNQGNCGSCWAFSATGALEALAGLNKAPQSFSEQQLVDCSGSFGNQACNGGLMDNAFKYVKANGIVNEADYPYKAVKQTCSKNGGPYKINGFVDIKNCNDLATALASRPVAIAVDATNWSPYKSGVFSNCKTALNHGVLLVGQVGGAWKVKNSWGAAWGESGYIRLAGGNTCGLCNVASYPTA
jgi:C1A family cysteine protease